MIHTPSPFQYSAVASNHDVLDPAVKGMKKMLRAQSRLWRRVVMTNSFPTVKTSAHMKRMAGFDWREKIVEEEEKPAFDGVTLGTGGHPDEAGRSQIKGTTRVSPPLPHRPGRDATPARLAGPVRPTPRGTFRVPAGRPPPPPFILSGIYEASDLADPRSTILARK
ncbi:hypothetical protein LTR65_006634 [Meristemomyces frigidus]